MIFKEDKKMDKMEKTNDGTSVEGNNIEEINNQGTNTISDISQISEINYLKKKVKRIEILNYITIVLLVTILASYFLVGVNSPNANQAKNEKELPKSLNKTVANKIINDIKDAYNSEDKNKLYNIMGEYARTIVTFEDFEKSLEQVKIAGKFYNASYTHYEYAGYQEGADIFVLFYVAKYEFGDGNAKVTIRVTDDDWEIIGFRFNFEN
jgi:hypothetical protein